MNHKILQVLKEKDVADVGIGTLIVFIAMVLVAGIAASVLIQTAGRLESQAMATGQQTIGEVATGLAVFGIHGYAAAGANISKLAITVRPRSGSTDIDLSQVFLELSDTDTKIILKYNSSQNNYAKRVGAGFDDLFNLPVFPGEGLNHTQQLQYNTVDDYGILVIEDADNSVSQTNPVINRGDKVMLTVYTYHCFNFSGTNGFTERKPIWGAVIPEQGSPGIISFTTPAAFNARVMTLQ
ncbi:MAG: flagellin [Candidatus Thermoplasmatota archaeon]